MRNSFYESGIVYFGELPQNVTLQLKLGRMGIRGRFLSRQTPTLTVCSTRPVVKVFCQPRSRRKTERVSSGIHSVSIDSLKTARSRFRKQIKAVNAPDEELFLRLLERKK